MGFNLKQIFNVNRFAETVNFQNKFKAMFKAVVDF